MYLRLVQEIEKGKRSLKEEWCPAIVAIFRACQVMEGLGERTEGSPTSRQKSKRKKILPPDTRLPAFLTCLANLMTAQLQVAGHQDASLARNILIVSRSIKKNVMVKMSKKKY